MYMKLLKTALLGSGTGSSIKAICDSVKCNILKIEITCILTNQKDCSYLQYLSKKNSIKYFSIPFSKKEQLREEYEDILIKKLCDIDLVVLAGWNHIVSDKFINSFKYVINLHPALPNTFVGLNCIKKAYNEYQKGNIQYTGSMVHYVIPEVDKGEVISTIQVPIYTKDSYDDLEKRQKKYEKGLLIESIQSIIRKYNEDHIKEIKQNCYIGKVRQVEDIGNKLLLFTTSDRLSAFNRHICHIPSKGRILNELSHWWFLQTEDIIENHYVYGKERYMIVKKTKPIQLEIVVRAYMTGTSKTSIWNMYEKGERDLYGISFRDGYKKNEILDEIVITPTTKDKDDCPISKEEIISKGLLNEKEYTFIEKKSLELFHRGQEIVDKKGYILVDTKYEFGRLENGEIILIDELHTCDSSRYWLKNTYQDKFMKGQEPDKLDKDCIRDWIKNVCDPYVDEISNVPEEMIEKVFNIYKKYYETITGNELKLELNLDLPLTKKSFLDYYFIYIYDGNSMN